jgi:hypothetical protein
MTKLAWEWPKYHFYINRPQNAIVANVEFRPIGFELYRGDKSVILYVELFIGTLMVRFAK